MSDINIFEKGRLIIDWTSNLNFLLKKTDFYMDKTKKIFKKKFHLKMLSFLNTLPKINIDSFSNIDKLKEETMLMLLTNSNVDKIIFNIQKMILILKEELNKLLPKNEELKYVTF